MPSIDDLEKLIALDPSDPFPRYAMAMELRKRGRSEEALAAFRELLERFPQYVPGHQQEAMTLEAAGRTEEARRSYERGIAAARAVGDLHAAEEMQGALERMG